jgi:prepilin signal peptidase PulO-like enzyme (type II secretory pathway)
MNHPVSAAFCALFFACTAYVAMQVSAMVCSGIAPADDGPPATKPPVLIVTFCAGLLGAALVLVGAEPLQLGIAAIVVFALAACWASDALCGLVPDAFTLCPLAALLLFAVAQRDWYIIVSAILVFIPFAVAAMFSRGMGMGWGDAKLVALTGAALGAPLGYFTLALACLVAVVVHRLGKRRAQPIAFAPYIAALTGVALPLGLTH